eukprot:TRINITY_DN670_c0_g1_i2.p1 TRINITY_DN670_c0_g1~~TRINITY_DN670_c0_g1_i2.p1  ORF type:complete len:252 (+),score=34.81 TRINITY_DN670_c0_g1_i2:107-862(+)
MIRRPPRSTQGVSSAASDVYKRQVSTQSTWDINMVEADVAIRKKCVMITCYILFGISLLLQFIHFFLFSLWLPFPYFIFYTSRILLSVWPLICINLNYEVYMQLKNCNIVALFGQVAAHVLCLIYVEWYFIGFLFLIPSLLFSIIGYTFMMALYPSEVELGFKLGIYIEKHPKDNGYNNMDGRYPPIAPQILTYYSYTVSYTHLRAHETSLHLVCRLLLEKKKKKTQKLQLIYNKQKTTQQKNDMNKHKSK